MRHAKIQKLVSEYIDGALKNNVELIERHIKNCDECKQLVKAHYLVNEILRENTIEVSPHLLTRIQAIFREWKSKQNLWDYIIAFSRELAIALVLIFLVLTGIKLISKETPVKIDEAILNEISSGQKVISTGGNLTKDDVLELTLSNGEKK